MKQRELPIVAPFFMLCHGCDDGTNFEGAPESVEGFIAAGWTDIVEADADDIWATHYGECPECRAANEAFTEQWWREQQERKKSKRKPRHGG